MVISSADADVWFAKPPCYVISDAAADEELGEAVVAAAQAVWVSAPQPSDDERDAWQREILGAVGVKDWATLERNARLAHIDLDADGWQIRRLRRFRGGGWVGVRDDERAAQLDSYATTGDIGRALRDALATPTMHAG